MSRADSKNSVNWQSKANFDRLSTHPENGRNVSASRGWIRSAVWKYGRGRVEKVGRVLI